MLSKLILKDKELKRALLDMNLKTVTVFNTHGEIVLNSRSTPRTSGSCCVNVYLLLSLTLPTYETAGPASEKSRAHRALVEVVNNRRKDEERGIMVAPR